MEKHKITISDARLSSFRLSDDDTTNVMLERYINNIKLSEALYPALSILEITLRNAINETIEKLYGQFWLFEELEKPRILHPQEIFKLKDAYSKLIKKYGSIKQVTKGKLVSELNFGFWIRLCAKKYNSNLWMKKGFFKNIFPYYPKDERREINKISNDLYLVLKLRNRIFHHEPIYKQKEILLKKYHLILGVLSLLPQDNKNILKQTCRFESVYNQAFKAKT